MSEHFDVLVIGTGPGGYVSALKAAQLGAKTAVVEKKAYLGGTCLNWGCIPSKALLASAELMDHIREAKTFGVNAGDPVADWNVIQKRKDKVLAKLRGGIKGLFGARKVTLFQGAAKIEAPGKVHIEGNQGAPSHDVTATNIILATGSEPIRLPGWPDDPERVCTSDEALHWKTMPKSVVIVGGGVIGCEFAYMLQPLGVEVTIVEMMPKLLGPMDSDISNELLKVMKKRGMKIHLNTSVDDMKIVNGGVEATLGGGDKIQAERCLVSIGRRPNSKGLGLENAGIAPNKRGFIEVNDAMETGVKGLYAIGDVNGKFMLAHAASAHGVTAAINATGGSSTFNAPIPACVYTTPEVSSVGLTQEQCRERNLPVSIGAFPLGHLGKAMAAEDTTGFMKVIRHRETDEVLGVHMIGHNVTEIIAAAGVAVTQKLKTHELADVVFAHPSISEGLKEASEDALGAALHLPPRKIMRVKVAV